MGPRFERCRPRWTVFPTARHTFGDDTMWTLENRPSAAISRAAPRITPAPQTIEEGPVVDFTEIRFIFMGEAFPMYNTQCTPRIPACRAASAQFFLAHRLSLEA